MSQKALRKPGTWMMSRRGVGGGKKSVNIRAKVHPCGVQAKLYVKKEGSELI